MNTKPVFAICCTKPSGIAGPVAIEIYGTVYSALYNLMKKKPYTFNSLPDDKMLDWSKLEQISDYILKCIHNEK